MGRRPDADYGRCPVCKTGILRRSDVTRCSRRCDMTNRVAQDRAAVVLPPPVEGARWIPLSSGRATLVDEADYEAARQIAWLYSDSPSGGYAAFFDRAGKKIYLHAWLAGPGVDHRDGNRLDNRRQNLRRASQQQNIRNARKRKDGTSRFKGVHLDKRNAARGYRKIWVAVIGIDRCPEVTGAFRNRRGGSVGLRRRGPQALRRVCMRQLPRGGRAGRLPRAHASRGRRMKTICRVVNKATREACGEPASQLVTFIDRDQVTACEPCALGLRETARSHGSNVKIERLTHE